MRRTIAVLLGLTILISQAHAQQEQRAKSTNYQVPSDVISSGGGDQAHSTHYLLDDTIGEANIGFGRSADYDINAGYRQPNGGTYLAMTCDTPVIIGTITFTGQATGSGTCVVTTDNEAGYSLSWNDAVSDGGTNTGTLISTSSHDVIPAFDSSASGLVGYWKLDETSAGSTVIDSSGNGNNGTPNGTAGSNNLPQPSTILPSNPNYADLRSLNFDGTDDTVSLSPSSLGSLKIFTISAWFKTTNTSAYQTIFSESTGGSGFFAGLYVGKIFLQNNASWLATGNVVPDTNWHLMTVTFDGTNGRTYLDGVVGQTGALPTPTTYSGNGHISGYNGVTALFSGDLDDIRVYNRVLSAAEIEALYNEPHPWTVASNAAAWGARLRSSSTDTDAKWGTDGLSDKWLNVGDGSYDIVTRTSRTSTGGSLETFQYRAEVGASAVVPNHTYQSTVTLTASAL